SSSASSASAPAAEPAMMRRRIVTSSLLAAAWLALSPCALAQSARQLVESCKPNDVESVAQRLKSLGDEGAAACFSLLVRGEIAGTPGALECARGAVTALENV